jgi:hypothetical protein
MGVFDLRRALARAIFLGVDFVCFSPFQPPRARRVRKGRTVASRCCSTPSRALRGRLATPVLPIQILVSLRVRLGTACPRCEPTSRASYVRSYPDRSLLMTL